MSLSRREIVLISILLLAGTIYAFYTYLFTPIKSQTDALKASNSQLQAALQKTENNGKNSKNQADNMKKLQSDYKILLTKVPEDPYVPEMMVYLADSARDSKVEINSMNYKCDDKPAATAPSENSAAGGTGGEKTNNPVSNRTTQIDIEVRGTYYSLLTFMLKVENSPRLFVITGVKFEAEKNKPAEVSIPAQQTALSPAAGNIPLTGPASPQPVPKLSGSAAYNGSDITLKLKFESYYDHMTAEGMKGVDQEVSPSAAGKNPFS